jgi:hypothetical protein
MIAFRRTEVDSMDTELLPNRAGPASNITFAARKVRMAREYYVEATARDQAKYRIGSFKVRAGALEWIETHAANWKPEQANTRDKSEGFSLCSNF